MFILTR